MTTAREALEKAMTIATLNSDPVTIFVKISALRDALPQVSVVNDTPAMNITVWKDGSYLCQAVGDDVCSRDDENWLVSIPLVPAFAAQSETQRSASAPFAGEPMQYLEGISDLPGLVQALGYQKQCDQDGVMCEVSRQAVEEARTVLARMVEHQQALWRGQAAPSPSGVEESK